MYLTLLFKHDFWKLLAVCLKMLFRKSTRKRFVCLVAAFLFTLGFNTHGYIKKFQDSESSKQKILAEKAFNVFFLRFRSKADGLRFYNRHAQALSRLNAVPLKMAFIYQNNLYVQFQRPLKPDAEQTDPEMQGLALLYDLFGIERAALAFLVENNPDAYTVKVKNNYIDHNGRGLDLDIVLARNITLKGDLADAANLIRGNLSGKRLAVFNDLTWRITNNIQRVPLAKTHAVNPFFSRVALIVPLNLFPLFKNMANDNTTDVLDYAESIRALENAVLEIEKTYLQPPPGYWATRQHSRIELYPRYIPLYVPDLLSTRWHWMLYEDIALNEAFIEKLGRLHFKGNYMFSFEKTLSIKERADKINADLYTNHINFYITDLSMGIVFPFMISLFAFIHLKSELAFLLMFKNRVRELLMIFWLLPLGLMLLVKGGLAYLYAAGPLAAGMATSAAMTMGLPMVVSFIVAAIVFFPINRWCFSQLTGENLNLAMLHKGR